MFDTLVTNATNAVTSGDNVIRIEEDITKYNNTYVKKNNKIYLLTIGQGTPKTYEKIYTGNDGVANDYLSSLYFGKTVYQVEYFLTRNTAGADKNKIQIEFSGQQYTITAQEVIIGETVSYTVPISDYRNTCDDALYDMFCMPVSPSVFGLEVPQTDVVVQWVENEGDDPQYIFLDQVSEYQLALATEIATKMGAGGSGSLIYDLQLLPYCPVENLSAVLNSSTYGPTYGKYVIDMDDFDTKDYTVLKNGSSVARGIVFYPKKANFTKTVDLIIPNTTVHYEWLTITNPVMLAQGSKDGLPLYRFANFPYTVTDGTWDIGPNTNNPNYNIELSDGLTVDECTYISLQVSPNIAGGDRPAWLVTSTEFPTPPTGQEYTYTFQGNFTLKVLAHWVLPDNSLDKKIKNECDFYRLVSPNYNGLFEFKNTKLQDGLQTINIDCTYKPYTPYIKLNPNLFGSLYSNLDYNDSTGLICGGDFSIPMLSDAMINYELQNRNYQAIFNRNIQNLDVNQQIAKEQQQFAGIVGAVTGGIGGTVTGAMAGAKAGPYGAIAGAVVGGTAGTAAGIIGYEKDKQWLQEQQTEARSFAVDQFQYQLGNIQALPQSITKSSALSFNNKVWPILEKFSCTDKEKELLENKIKYNGMTIMAIGQLLDYSVDGGYLKGKMIRLVDLGDDSHVAQAIYEEVDKGFYEGE